MSTDVERKLTEFLEANPDCFQALREQLKDAEERAYIKALRKCRDAVSSALDLSRNAERAISAVETELLLESHRGHRP